MRKATKVLLLIAEIFSYVYIGLLFTAGILYIALGFSVDSLFDYLRSTGESITYYDVEQILAPLYIVLGCIFCILALLNIATGLLTKRIRKAYIAGGEKAEFKGKAIALIILGALANEICIVPAIFLLCQKEESFKE